MLFDAIVVEKGEFLLKIPRCVLFMCKKLHVLDIFKAWDLAWTISVEDLSIHRLKWSMANRYSSIVGLSQA